MLGKDYTAFYEKTLKNVPEGVLRVEVEMRFKRFYGLARSYRKVKFPYVSFKNGQRTKIEHYFNSANTFDQYRPKKKKPIPVISEMKLQGASGSVALNIPLIK